MQTNAVPFDQNAIGDQLELTVSNQILQTTVQGTDAHRLARSQYGQGGAIIASAVEFYIYSDNGATPSLGPSGGVPAMTVGLVDQSASLAKYVGEDVHGWGFCPGDGNLYNNGAVVAAFAVCPLNSYIGVLYDYGNAIISFTCDGALIGSYAVAIGMAYYAASVSGDPGDMAVWANAGQTPMKFPPYGITGWLHLGIGITPTYVATEPYITDPNDDRPNQKYKGDLARGSASLSIARAVRFWFWGASAPAQLNASSSISIPLLDPNKIYRELFDLDVRDQIVTARRGGSYPAAMADSELICEAILDKCRQPTLQTKTLNASGKLALLQAQLIRALFPPNADPSLAGKPLPMRTGINRNFSPSPYDNTNLLFAATDEPITGVGKGLDQGKEIGFGIDWNLTADGKNISRPTAPPGKFTIETTTFGGSYDPALTDLLGGDGDFGSATDSGGGLISTSSTSITVGTGSKAFNVGAGKPFVASSIARATSRGSGAYLEGNVTSYSGSTLTINVTTTSGSGAHTDWDISGGVNQPTNWIGGGGYLGADAKNTIWQLLGTAPNEYVQQAQKADAVYWMQHATLTLAPGDGVAYEIVVKQAPYYGPSKDVHGNPMTIFPAKLIFGGLTDFNVQFYPWEVLSVPAAATYRGSFVNNRGATLPLVFGFLCNSLIQGTGSVFSYLQIQSIKLVALPSITQNVELDGPGLDWLLRRIWTGRGQLSIHDYDATGAQAIDDDNGYKYGLSVSENETPTAIGASQPLLDSCGASPVETRDGKVGVFRLTPPEDATSVQGSLGITDFATYLEPIKDGAENLTSRAQGTRNVDKYVDSDFANVTQDDVPQIVRNLLKADYQTTKTAGVVLPTQYSYANNARPLATCLDRAEDVQAEITRVCSMFTEQRHFYVGTAFSPFGRLFDIGQVWTVTYPNGNLDDGQQLVIVGVEDHPTEGTATLVFWGL